MSHVLCRWLSHVCLIDISRHPSHVPRDGKYTWPSHPCKDNSVSNLHHLTLISSQNHLRAPENRVDVFHWPAHARFEPIKSRLTPCLPKDLLVAPIEHRRTHWICRQLLLLKNVEQKPIYHHLHPVEVRAPLLQRPK